MTLIANLLISFVALSHLGFLALEMFLWTKPPGLKVFRNTPEKAETTKILAANQGLYNGFLAAGLIWSLVNEDPSFSYQLKFFFLGCVVVAGIFGAATVNKRIFFVQAMPAILAMVFLFLSAS